MSRSVLSVEDRRVDEGTSAQYNATITDESETAIPLADLTAITLTLYDYKTGTIINSRTDQDVKNANDVSITSAGVLTWNLKPADNVIVTTALPTNAYERHIALFEYTWDSGTNAGKHELTFEVRQLDKVT
tara:strand:+ start:242 stop:634 length:393 start_codon:yes stop_codon:yes gene_type:complete